MLGTTAASMKNVTNKLNETFKRIVERSELEKYHTVYVEASTQVKEWENIERKELVIIGNTVASPCETQRGNNETKRVAKLFAGAFRCRKEGEERK